LPLDPSLRTPKPDGLSICIFVVEADMANLTINIDEEVLKQARIRALGENMSVNDVLGEYLMAYARLDGVRRNRLAALDRLLKIADENPIDRGGRQWRRDELYDR